MCIHIMHTRNVHTACIHIMYERGTCVHIHVITHTCVCECVCVCVCVCVRARMIVIGMSCIDAHVLYLNTDLCLLAITSCCRYLWNSPFDLIILHTFGFQLLHCACKTREGLHCVPFSVCLTEALAHTTLMGGEGLCIPSHVMCAQGQRVCVFHNVHTHTHTCTPAHTYTIK